VPGIVKAQENNVGSRWVIATRQTLAHGEGMARLEQVLAHGAPALVWPDEAHHAPVGQYLDILERCHAARAADGHQLMILGTTATPIRADDEPMRRVFSVQPFRYDIKTAIEEEHLAPINMEKSGVITIEEFNLDGLKIGASGEYSDSDIADRLMKAPNAFEVIFDKWQERAGDRQSIVYVPSIKPPTHEIMAAIWESHGYRVACVDGSTPDDERGKIDRAFMQGEIDAIFNHSTYIEGKDLPPASCILIARPVRSPVSFTQMVGRGLRLYPDKPDCVILTVSPADAIGFMLPEDILGEPPKVRAARRSASDSLLPVFAQASINVFGIDAEIDPDDVVVRRLDFWSKTPFTWTEGDGLATCSLSDKVTLAVVFPQEQRRAEVQHKRGGDGWTQNHEDWYKLLGTYMIYLVIKQELDEINPRTGNPKTRTVVDRIASRRVQEDALEYAENYADEHAEAILAHSDKSWRREPASQPQIGLASTIGVFSHCTDEQKQALIDAGKGALARAITHKFAIIALEKARVMRREDRLARYDECHG
jgi:hypothetical protein